MICSKFVATVQSAYLASSNHRMMPTPFLFVDYVQRVSPSLTSRGRGLLVARTYRSTTAACFSAQQQECSSHPPILTALWSPSRLSLPASKWVTMHQSSSLSTGLPWFRRHPAVILRRVVIFVRASSNLLYANFLYWWLQRSPRSPGRSTYPPTIRAGWQLCALRLKQAYNALSC